MALEYRSATCKTYDNSMSDNLIPPSYNCTPYYMIECHLFSDDNNATRHTMMLNGMLSV